MSDTEKKYQNSSAKKTDYSTLIYFLVWLFLSALIATGGVLIYNWWDKRSETKKIKQSIHNVQDIVPKDNEFDKRYENTRGRIYTSSHRVKKFENKINENPKELGIWKEDLEKIKARLTPYEKLKQVKHDPDQLEEVWLAAYRDQISLNTLEFLLFSPQETRQQWEDQIKWLAEKADQEAEDAKEHFNKLITYFYHRFLDTLPSELKTTPSNIWPVEIEGHPANTDNPSELKEEINYLVAKYGLCPLERKWGSFGGYDIDESKTKEGTHIMGLTTTDPSEFEYRLIKEGSDEFKYFSIEVATVIKLKKELLFSRQNRYYTAWINSFDEEKNTAGPTLDISEDSLLNTIAHELAHAIINFIRFEYETDNGGHGDLHDDYTDQIEDMIKKDSRWEEFLDWWREPQNNKHD